MSGSPKTSQKASRDEENGSGVFRNGKGYIVDGVEVKGIMLRWRKYRPRIEAMERKAGYKFNKKGYRIPLRVGNPSTNKRDATEADLPDKPNEDESESGSESSDSSEEEEAAPIEEAKEAKKKAIPQKNAKKRQKTAK